MDFNYSGWTKTYWFVLVLFALCVCVSVCVCVFSWDCFNFNYTRCILGLIRYYLLLHFFMHNILYSLLMILHKFLTPRWAIFIRFLGYPIKSWGTTNSTNPHSMLFSERNKENRQKSTCAKILRRQQFCLNFFTCLLLVYCIITT